MKYQLLAMIAAVCVLGAWAYEDEFVTIDDETVVAKTVGDRQVYVFTNTAATVTLKTALTLEEALLVGGGGAGGWSILTPDEDRNNGGSCGGGGGGVIWTNCVSALTAGKTLEIAVGAGGDPEANSDGGAVSGPRGGKGGDTSLAFGSVTLTAFGGGGGGGYGQKYPTSGRIGSGGGFVKVANYDYQYTYDGTYYTSSQGNCGSYTISAGTGGGGGAGERQKRGSNANSGTAGGQGLPIAITGERETYGSGGGGGYPYRTGTNAGGVGGTNAGQGLAVSAGNSQHGKDGFGGGGGGSSRVRACMGGRGGCGTVILSFSLGDNSARKLEIDPIGTYPLVDGAARPPVVVRSGDAVLVEGTDYTLTYTNNTVRGRLGIAEVTGLGDYAGHTAHRTFDVAKVYYASYDGDDAADGTSWATATSVSNALLIAEADSFREIWLKAGTYMLTAGYSTTKAIAVRGGFAGDDANLSRLADDPRSVFDGHDAIGTCFSVGQVKTAMPMVEFERCVFRNATARNFSFNSYYGVRFIDCAFLSCKTGFGQTGRGLYISGNSSPATLIGCEISGNVLCSTTGSREGGSGCGVNFGSVDAWMDGCLFVSNGLTAAYSQSSNPDSNHVGSLFNAGRVRVQNCRFIGNRSTSRWGSGSSNGGGMCTVTGNGSYFRNCLWLGNSEQGAATFTGAYGGCLSVSVGQTVTVSRCTFAYNLHMANGASAGITVRSGNVVVEDSIFYGNVCPSSDTYGSDIGLAAGTTATIRRTMFAPGAEENATKEKYISAPDSTQITLGEDVIYGDPKFVTSEAEFLATLNSRSSGSVTVPRSTTYTTFAAASAETVAAFDAHLLSSGGYYTNDGEFHRGGDVTSPAILSDGTNLGYCGGTAEASLLDQVTPAVEGDITVVWTNSTSQPVIAFRLGGNGGAGYNAKVTVGYGVAGDMHQVVYPSLAGQADYSVIGDSCFPKDAEFSVSVTVEVGGTIVWGVYNGTVEADYPPGWGKGGGAGVLHVRSDATGRGDGSDWFNAMTDYYSALDLLTADKHELWLAGDIRTTSQPTAFNKGFEMVIRGGFAGVETNAADRTKGAVSTFDGAAGYVPLRFGNSQKVTLDSIRSAGCPSQGLVKSGAGDLVLTNCELAVNGKSIGMLSYSQQGYGLYAAGSSGTTELKLTDCRFIGNGLVSGEGWGGYIHPSYSYRRDSGDGYAAYVENFRRVTLDNCLFLTNGVPFDSPASGYPGGGSAKGTTFAAVSAPVTMRSCRFVGNRAYGNSGNGGTVSLGTGTAGSVLTNCLFLADEITKFTDNYGYLNAGGGELKVAGSSTNDLYEAVNCTFAYNLADIVSGSGVGVNLRKGHLKVKNCIFAGNSVGRRMASGALDAAVETNSTLEVSYSLFQSPSTIYRAPGGKVIEGSGVRYGDAHLVTPTNGVPELRSYYDGSVYRGSAAVLRLIAANVHLRGNLGYIDETTGLRVTDPTWGHGNRSPGIDAGDPSDEYSNEPDLDGIGDHGRRINMGFYGNTPWATMSPLKGNVLRLR